MGRAIMLRGQTKDERHQHKADGSLFLRRENKNFATNLF